MSIPEGHEFGKWYSTNSLKENYTHTKEYYNTERNKAMPPFWQAIFSGAENIDNAGTGNLIEEGILAILQDFKKVLDGAEISDLVIDDVGQFEAKVETLSKLTALKKLLIKTMKDKKKLKTYNMPKKEWKHIKLNNHEI